MNERILHLKYKNFRRIGILQEGIWNLPIRKSSILFLFFMSHIMFQTTHAGALNTPHEDIMLIEALQRLSHKYEVFFSYDETSVAHLEVQYQDEKYTDVENALDQLLSGTMLMYKIFDSRYIILYEQSKEAITSLKGMVKHLETVIDSQEKNNIHRKSDQTVAFLQNKVSQAVKQLVFNVSGTVTDDAGVPLIGVNVQVKGTNTGTATDIEGNFTLDDIDENSILIFSYVGYQTQEVAVAGKSNLTVTLVSDSQLLDEVVVIGYGTQKKSDLTGSISSISNKDILERPITDAAQALQGRASGVVATASGGRPGDGVTLRVRGRRSLTASNDPLFIVDGIPLEGGINDINPQDIMSMEVLKDASATAIYGSRGANGVVIITTKRGGDFKTIVSYSGYTGSSSILVAPDMMNGEEFKRMKEISGFEFNTVELKALENGVSTDWLDLVTQNGFQQSHQLGVRGGDSKTQFALSANYFTEKGVIKTQDFKRSSFRINLDHSISDAFKVGTSTQLSYKVQDRGGNVFGIAVPSRPLSPAYNEDGSIFKHPGGDDFRISPLFSLKDGSEVDKRTTNRLFSNIFGVYNITEKINYRFNFGVDIQNFDRGLYESPDVHTSLTRGTDLALKSSSDNRSFTLENILTYSETFGEDHKLDLTGLYSFQTSNTQSTNVQAVDLPYKYQLYHNIGSAESISGIGSNLSEWAIVSYMARANYQLKGKYLLTFTGRYDGSSRLAKGKKWGFFPSAAVAWRISEETFMANQNIFPSLRLRASYGVTGNTGISPYQTRGGLARSVYSFSSSSGYGYKPSSLVNPDLRWESSASINLGIDFSILDYRINGNFDIYQTSTSDLLLARTIPITSGYNSILENIGDTRNRGYELSIYTVNISNVKFSWETNFNIFGNNEEIVKLLGTGTDDIGNKWFIGHPLTVFYDLQKLGIWQLNENDQATKYGQKSGDIKVKDVNGDGIINQKDFVILGTDMPKLSLGFGNRLSYKSFDFSFFLYGSFGQIIYNNYEVGSSTMVGRYNNLNVDYWTPDNPTNSHPRPDGFVERPLYGETRGYMSGDFLKVKNIQLGYTLPENILSNIGIHFIKFYVNADTPFMFTKVDNIDPESSGGRIGGDTPSTRLFSVGVNIDF